MFTDTQKRNLVKICNAKIGSFRKFGETTETKHGPMIFQDNGSDILAVAHLDFVCGPKAKLRKDRFGQYVQTGRLDDRLGVWLLLDVLPKLGVKFDLLLTDSEESGNSTAQYFQTEKQYNWCFEFDRRKNDCVTYQYQNPDWLKALDYCDWNIGTGAFSDISYLEQLGVCCVNFGCGYQQAHTKNCFAYFSDIFSNVKRFLGFWGEYQNHRFEHIETPTIGYRASEWLDYVPYRNYQDTTDNRWGAYTLVDCVCCGDWFEPDELSTDGYCDDCFDYMLGRLFS